MTARHVTHATFTIERIYDASPERVFRAFSDPALKRQWFAEDEGRIVESYDLDFRVGGIETSQFHFQGGEPMRYDAVYQDIVPNQRMIAAYSMAIGDNRISASLATAELTPAGKGTKVVFTEQGAYLDGFDNVEQREEGTRELFESLARALEREPA